MRVEKCTVTVFLGQLRLEHSLLPLVFMKEITIFLRLGFLYLLIGQHLFKASLLLAAPCGAFLTFPCCTLEFLLTLLNALRKAFQCSRRKILVQQFLLMGAALYRLRMSRFGFFQTAGRFLRRLFGRIHGFCTLLHRLLGWNILRVDGGRRV